MPTNSPAAAASRGGVPRRYGLLLITLLASYLLSASFQQLWISGLEVALFTAAGLLALRGSPAHNQVTRLVTIAAIIVSVAMIVISASFNTDLGHTFVAIWAAGLLLITVVLLIRQILMMPTVTIQSIFGAVSAYLIIGLAYASIYAAAYYLHGRTFFAAGQPGQPATFQYFSFTTLTTLGYGDFTAAHADGRAIAMIEAMTGQIFLATLVARLVAAFRPTAQAMRGTGADEES